MLSLTTIFQSKFLKTVHWTQNSQTPLSSFSQFTYKCKGICTPVTSVIVVIVDCIPVFHLFRETGNTFTKMGEYEGPDFFSCVGSEPNHTEVLFYYNFKHHPPLITTTQISVYTPESNFQKRYETDEHWIPFSHDKMQTCCTSGQSHCATE